MDIVTKFNVNDKVYYMKNNKVTSSTVQEISIEVSPNMYLVPTVRVKYAIDGKDHSNKYKESQLFNSKHELLDSL